jgi:hypothetical protein
MRPTPLRCFPRTMAKTREAVVQPPASGFVLRELTRGVEAPGQAGAQHRTAWGKSQGRRDDRRQARRAAIRAGGGLERNQRRRRRRLVWATGNRCCAASVGAPASALPRARR